MTPVSRQSAIGDRSRLVLRFLRTVGVAVGRARARERWDVVALPATVVDER